MSVLLFSFFISGNLYAINENKLTSPKIIKPSGSILSTTTPIIKWNAVKNANGYTVYVQKEGEIIFQSSNYGLITRTEFEFPKNILLNEKKYTIYLRAYNSEQWSDYSKPVEYFIQNPILKTELETPKIITKNGVITEGKTDDTKNSLVWESVHNANNYEIIIDGVNSSAIFGDEYKNIVSTTQLDSIFTLDSELFKNYDKYRWKVRSKNSNSNSKYSAYYYFDIIEEENKVLEENAEEIIMRLKYAGVIDEYIIAKYRQNKVLLPTIEILSLLQLNHKIDYDLEIISGLQHNKSKVKYELKLKSRELIIDEYMYAIPHENLVNSDLEYFITKDLLEKITSLRIEVDMNNLVINIQSDFILPMVQRKLNEQKLSLYRDTKSQNNYPLLFNRERKYISGGFLDYSVAANLISGRASNYYTNFGLGAELFGGGIQITSQQSILNQQLNFNQIKYKWQYTFLDNENISTLSTGYNNSYGLNSYEIHGVKISNEPIEPRKNLGSYEVYQNTKPNWKVEVYHNTQLIDIVEADDKGEYKFLIPFSYGTTMLELHEIGPNGEYKISNKMFQIPIEQIPEGKFDYSLNFGKLANSDELILQSNSKYGINNWLTTQISTDIFANDFSHSSIFSRTTARFFDNYITNLTIAPNAYHELSVNSILNNQTSFSAAARLYEDNEKLNPSDIKSEIEGNLFLPVEFEENIFSFLLRGRYTKFSNSNRADVSLRTFYNFHNFSPSLEANYYNLKNELRSFESMHLNFRLNYNLNISSEIFAGNIFETLLSYNLTQRNLQSINISISTTLLKQFRVQLSHINNIQNKYSDTQLSIIFDLPFFRSSTRIAKNTLSQSIVGSINYNEHAEEFNYYNRGMIGRSAASFKFFVDQNMNEIYDEGEQEISDMDIRINSIGNKIRNGLGNIIVNDLESYSRYDVKLIDRYNKNPLWFPYREKFSFISDPHQFKEIEIPFYEAAEVLGTVNKKSFDNLIPVSGLNIMMKNKDTGKVIRIKTMSDGSFYHYGIRPGNYEIYLDEEQLVRLKLKSSPELFESSIRSISVEEDFTEFNFVLE